MYSDSYNHSVQINRILQIYGMPMISKEHPPLNNKSCLPLEDHMDECVVIYDFLEKNTDRVCLVI